MSSTLDTTPDPDLIDRRQPKGWLAAPRRTVLLFTAAFVLIELIGAFFSITAQVFLTALAALFAVNFAIFGYRTNRTAGLVMAALFSTRLMVLTLPLAGVSLSTRTAIIAAASIPVAYIATWVLSVDVAASRSDEGFPLRPPLVSKSFTSALTVLSGFPIGWIGYQLLTPAPLEITPAFGAETIPWLLAIGAFVLGAFGEELLFRRLVAAMVQYTGQSQTPWISATLFAAAYLGTRNFGYIALVFFAGALFAWSCERTGSLRPVVAAHSIATLLVFVVLPN